MIKYSLLRILRDRVTIFWALCFPFILATLFEVSFGHMNDSLDQIQTAVSSELIDDLLFSPLEISVLKRRIKASIHPDKNNEADA